MRKLMTRLWACLCTIIMLSSLCGCRAQQEKESFQVVTSFYPIYIMAMNLMDGVDDVELRNMAKPSTGCLHDYQLRPTDLVTMDGADLFLANGGGMEDFMSDVLEAYPKLKVVYAVDALSEDQLICEEDEVNPHTWLDPRLYREELRYFADALKKADPEHAQQYEANCLAYQKKVDRLITELETGQVSAKAVILHESFPYLLEPCGVTITDALDVEKDSGFSVKEMIELVESTEESGAAFICSDSQYSGRISDLIAEETGMKVVKLDSCVKGEYDKDAYIDTMERNYRKIREKMETTRG